MKNAKVLGVFRFFIIFSYINDRIGEISSVPVVNKSHRRPDSFFLLTLLLKPLVENKFPLFKFSFKKAFHH